MKLLSKSIFVFLIIIFSQLTTASGQRTAVITTDALNKYKVLRLKNDEPVGKVLHYMGTINNKVHLLMVTKTSSSRTSSGKIERPWSHVFKYKISVDEMTIVNGWDLTDKIKQDNFRMRPSYCPRLIISSNQKKYILANNKKMKSACITMRRRY
ncbi:MAG: hypothetical protein KAT06_07170 [Gammaproteobacteria bacterium]|nr:hypothetical protein [Gammaproteobacteria bacterium]